MFNDLYQDVSILVTGHTGFKGSWLSLWLNELDARVSGMALSPDTTPNHWDLLKLDITDYRLDIRDLSNVLKVFKDVKPEIVFHLAAQPLVRRSYINPLETWSTNVIGTANILEACRKTESIKAIIVVTTDKVYENKEWIWGYRESDRLGGYDPYSTSKVASELVVESYRKSFFNNSKSPLVATARAGNVIGGGDWAEDRLIPDIVHAMNNNKVIDIRSPYATRPWQHVLDCLNGYLLLGTELMKGNREFADSWNFGPNLSDNCTVLEVLKKFKKYWQDVDWSLTNDEKLHEAMYLYLDSTKARSKLNWKQIWNLDQSINATARWYNSYYTNNKVESKKQIKEFVKDISLSGCRDADI